MTPSRMPAEWEPHEATWIAWPHNKGDWPGKFGPIRWVFAEVARLLAPGERVAILVKSATMRGKAADVLDRAGVDLARVDFHAIRTDRAWTRDTGPTFVLDPENRPSLLDWRFNGWAKYDDHRRDDRVPAKIAGALGLPRTIPRVVGEEPGRVVLEGGSIDVNGKGTLLTTEECLLSPVQERNPGLGRADYERAFAEYLGVRHVIWLGGGVAGDDTHGHVDDLSRFVDATTVVTAIEPNRADENHAPLAENLRRLHAAVDQDGRALDVVELPMPRPVGFEGRRLPASYANFYIGEAAVLVPTFNDPADRVALRVLEGVFPGREVVGVHALDLVWGLGALHCMTQQQPRAARGAAGSP